MEVVEVKLKVLTPMFSFGDENSYLSKAEFRITELKALMRSTFRELYYFEDLKDMKIMEGKLFGDMGRKSPIVFRVTKIRAGDGEEEYLLPHRTNKQAESEIRKTSCLGKSKVITFSMLTNSGENLDFYIKLLISSSILGSIGKRSRKGFGSFKVEEIKINGKNKYEDLLNQDLIKYWEKLQEDKEFKTRIVTINPSTKWKSSANFSECNMKFPYLEKVTFLSTEKFDYDYLLKEISDLTHKRLYKNFSEELIKEENLIIDKQVLGNCKEISSKKKLNRFASPIYITFSEHNNRNYLVIKELNYKYILEKLKIYENDKNYNVNRLYVEKFIKEIEIIFERMKKMKKGECS